MILIPILVFILLAFARMWSGAALAHVMAPGDIAALNRGLAVAMVVTAAFFLDGLVRYFYWHRYWRRRRGRETPALIRDLLTTAIVVLGLSIALWWIEGLSFTGLVTASGATAIILGIALQTVIQDLFSGLSINLEGSYGLGDWLTVYGEKMEPAYGQVTAMTWRSTYLTLLDGRCLMVPNHVVTANAALNHSRNPGPKRLNVEIPIDSRVPANLVIDLLLGEALKTARDKRLAAIPAPTVHVHHVTGDATYYHVLFYADPSVIGPDIACSIMLHAMLGVSQRNALPTPVTQVEMSPKPELSLALGPDRVREALSQAKLFRGALSEAQRDALAQRCTVREFRVGDVIMRQGDTTALMFIVLAGAARVTVAGPDGNPQEVAILAMDDVAGEMTLMTGAPRTATVTAVTGLYALEIDKDAVAPLLQQSPELLSHFSEILEERQQQLLALANRPVMPDRGQPDILSRIRGFFGLN